MEGTFSYAVNGTRNKTTGYSPHYLMFGREAVLPIDQVFRGVGGASAEIVTSHKKFVQDWEKSMKLAFEIARKNIDKSANYNKTHYDKRAKAVALQVGDQVLVQNMREKVGKPKMRSYYEENIFKVVEVRQDVPVYKIQNIKKAKDVRVVHRNKLLKVDQLPVDVFEDGEKTASSGKNKKKDNREIQVKQQLKENEEHQEIEDSDEEEVALVVEHRRLVDGSADVEDSLEEVHLGQENSIVQDEAVQDSSVDMPDAVVSEEAGVAVLLEVEDSASDNEPEAAEEERDDSTASEGRDSTKAEIYPRQSS